MDSHVTARGKWSYRWDDEEILRGRRRRNDGSFGALNSTWHRDDEHAARIRSILNKGHKLFQDSSTNAIETLIEVMNDSDQPGAVRVRCAELILDRVFGKAPQTVNLSVSTPFERLMMGMVLEFVCNGQEGVEVIDTTAHTSDDDDIIWDDEEDNA